MNNYNDDNVKIERSFSHDDVFKEKPCFEIINRGYNIFGGKEEDLRHRETICHYCHD